MLSTWLTRCCWIYLVVLVALPLVWRIAGEDAWILGVLRLSPAVAYLVPLLLLGMAAWPLKQRAALLPLLLSLLVVTFVYANLVLHFGPARPGQLKVLVWNIHWGVLGDEGVAGLVADSGADLALLQETYPQPPQFGPSADPVPFVTARLPGFHFARGGDAGELLVASRWPLGVGHSLELGEDRPGLLVQVEHPQGPFQVLNIHLSHGRPLGPGDSWTDFLVRTARARTVQSAHLERFVEEAEGPMLVGGDFNSPPGARCPAAVGARLQDCFATAGLGFGQTYNSHLRLWRIDYLFASSRFRVRLCRVLKTDLSDHLPLWTELDL